jgi:ubiquinone/menaquinone biosynthesis C-methylase UbiE
MTQNIYDNPEFFQVYSQMRRSVQGLDGAAEWPALRPMLPALRGKRILDLGCGFGWFARWAREQGSGPVQAIDVSEKMLQRAREMTADEGIAYQRVDLEEVELPAASFDLAFSSLALHYIESLERLLVSVQSALVPDGWFVFSMEHPVYTAPRHQGWVEYEGQQSWVLNSYLTEGARATDWLAKGVIKQHRTLATMFNLLLRSGFTVTHLEEWGPAEEQIAASPEMARERERPMLLLVAARRGSTR